MYEELKEIQNLLWKHDDLMDQETLFELQDKVANITLSAARSEGKIVDLIDSFKWLYGVED